MSRVSLTIVTPSYSDDRGASVPDWDTTTSTKEAGWRLQPVPAAEIVAMGRQGITSMLRGFGPVDSPITEHDRVVYDGFTYEVDGSVNHFPSITGAMAHVEVILKRVEG